MWDFKDRPLREDITVEEMYFETKLPILRFYLAIATKTVSFNDLSNDSDTESLPKIIHTERQAAQDDMLQQAMTMAGIEQAAPILTVEEAVDIVEFPDIEPVQEHKLRVHRGHILKELIKAFQGIDPLRDIVSLEIILPNGELEAAEDNGGVTRDAICEFWSSFYEECTLGNTFKVPCLRHDFGELEWQSVAKIIVFGYTRAGYFPVLLSLAFMEQCLYNQVKSDLKDAFMLFIPENDAQILRAAISDIKSVETDDLLDVLEQHEVKVMPKQDNIERIVTEVAHKELIQAAMFVVDCWSPFMKSLKLKEDKLISLHKELSPTPRRVLGLLKFSDLMSAEESTVANHLRRFVRELDKVSIARFLRFCTGSDLMIREKIDVSFVNVKGLARRPVAHTCSCLLELPKTYENFPQFRTEFMSVLNANVWIMDII